MEVKDTSPENQERGANPALRYEYPEGRTIDEMRDHIRKTEFYQIGDAKLVWVNEGDLIMHSRHPELCEVSAPPASILRVPDLTNEQKEITLLRIIEAMGGETDSSESKHSWLNWFCADEIHNTQEDTFNRCNDKGWLHTTHETSFDISTTTLTTAGRAVLSTATGDDNDR